VDVTAVRPGTLGRRWGRASLVAYPRENFDLIMMDGKVNKNTL